jgi:hypothetical protein
VDSIMTLGFRLTFKELPDGRLSLSVPLFYRLLLIGIGVLILAAVVLTAPEGDRRLLVPSNILPLIISLLSLVGGAYHERWIFDRPRGEITHRFGVAFFGTTRRYPLGETEALELEGIGRTPQSPRYGGAAAGSAPAGGEAPPGGSLAGLGRRSSYEGGLSTLPRGLFFRRGPIVTLWMNAKDGSTHRLETYAPSQRARALEAARSIAEYCGLPLIGA